MIDNPLYKEFNTYRDTVPYNSIKDEHFLPAIEHGIAEAKSEIKKICDNPDVPTIENTVVAMERSGRTLDRVCGVFYPLVSAMNNDQRMSISIKAGELLSEYSADISLNMTLWRRVKYVYDHTDMSELSPEDAMLLKNSYDYFVRHGAMLEGENREKYRAIKSELSNLTTKFAQNVVKELSTYKLWLREDDLAGLPDSLKESAAYNAAQQGRKGEYLITLDQPCYIPFMKYSEREDLRKQLYEMYTRRNSSGEYNNIPVLERIAYLRLQLANLFGYDTYADYSLVDTMAQNRDNVYTLLHKLAEAYRDPMRQELKDIESYASQTNGKPVKITPWNYTYYANKLKEKSFGYDEEAMRPYFELSSVIKGIFGLASRLYGLKFAKKTEIEVYQADVTAYEVCDSDGSYLGILYTDFFPREGKQPGAWMTDIKGQWIDPDGHDSRPHVAIVMNFTKPTDTKPSLLTPSEVNTFLHEFGHALHGLLSKVSYNSLSGTNVYRDFVELPSQFNENFLTQREFLDSFARHYKTGELLPQSLVDSLIASHRFGAAYACMRQLFFGFLDMGWHTITSEVNDAESFEISVTKDVAVFVPVAGSMVSPQFNHIFAGGYAAGYYSYKWAELLDADAFSIFETSGVMNPDIASRFRHEILERGGSENPAVLYRRFRGGEPDIKALLRRDGIIDSNQNL